MTPTTLRPGDRVRFAESRHVLTFIRRERGRPSMCVFENPELGTVTATDAEVIRRFRSATDNASGTDPGR
ncbi:MAG: hypothetical protein CALGDGBN_03553 [Pseudomonadales bacterium]|nr:hypothetical protein [Pseudomonadales bacterium]